MEHWASAIVFGEKQEGQDWAMSLVILHLFGESSIITEVASVFLNVVHTDWFWDTLVCSINSYGCWKMRHIKRNNLVLN